MATAGLVAVVVTFGVFLPALGELGRVGQAAPADPPRMLELCGGTWARGATATIRTVDEIRTVDGRDPIVVSATGPAACPAGACGSPGADASCSNVVYVKTGDEAYVRYELLAGP